MKWTISELSAKYVLKLGKQLIYALEFGTVIDNNNNNCNC